MPHATLEYRSPTIGQNGWGRGDTVVLLTVLAYAIVNVVFVLMYVNNRFGPVRISIIFLLHGISILGAMAAFPMQLVLRRAGVTWRSAAVVVAIFLGLAGFNYWCFSAALKALAAM